MSEKKIDELIADKMARGSTIIGALISVFVIASNPFAVSATGISLLAMGELIKMATNAKMRRRLQAQYALYDQTPSGTTLLAQLRDPTHVVVAHYTVAGELTSVIVAMRDKRRFDILYRKVEAALVEEAVAAADNNEVFFSAGPE